MRILDRYVLQKFLLPFVYCFLGFIAIWFILTLATICPIFFKARQVLTSCWNTTNPKSQRSLSPFPSERCLLFCIP